MNLVEKDLLLNKLSGNDELIDNIQLERDFSQVEISYLKSLIEKDIDENYS